MRDFGIMVSILAGVLVGIVVGAITMSPAYAQSRASSRAVYIDAFDGKHTIVPTGTQIVGVNCTPTDCYVFSTH